MSENQKDVLYIDVEDDITSIIGKVKASKHKVIALVPPKRVGVLQSAVNLRLLVRAAKQGNKKLVLITNNHALLALAATASLGILFRSEAGVTYLNLGSDPHIRAVSCIAGSALPQ
jgi:hypothetical protein